MMYNNSSTMVLSSNDKIYKLETDSDLQKNLCELFSKQTEEMINEKTLIPFDGNYKPNEDELFIIRNYQMPDFITDAIRNPLGVPAYEKINGRYPEIKAVLIGKKQENGHKEEFSISFQKMRKEQIVSKNKLSIILDNNTFVENKKLCFGISENIDCAFLDGGLYFNSYFFARQVLELGDYYRTATDSDVEDFIKMSELEIADKDLFRSQAQSSWLRRKIASINDSGVLKSRNAKSIKAIAKKTGIQIEITGNKILIPEAKEEVKIILGFLDEEAYRGPFSNTTYLAGSKRKI